MHTPNNIRPIDQQELTPRNQRRVLIIGGSILLCTVLLAIWWWPTDPPPPAGPEQPQPGRPSIAENREPETPTATADIRGLSAMSTSIDLDVIETDLESTDLDRLNAEFQAIETLLQP